MTTAPAERLGWRRLGLMVASVGGVGRAPIAPATAGSAAAVGLYLLLPADALWQLAAIALVTTLGVWSAAVAVSAEQEADPPFVVIDEVAGMLVACFLVPRSPVPLGVAFVLFRVFDIWKGFPMAQAERLPGGWGIVADDLVAGLLTRVLLLLTRVA